jgi:hypothetical protein
VSWPCVVVLLGVPPPPLPPPPGPPLLPVCPGLGDGELGVGDTEEVHPPAAGDVGAPVGLTVGVPVAGADELTAGVAEAAAVPLATMHSAGGMENGSRPPTMFTGGLGFGLGVGEGEGEGEGPDGGPKVGPTAMGSLPPPPRNFRAKTTRRTAPTAPRMMTARRSREESGTGHPPSAGVAGVDEPPPTSLGPGTEPGPALTSVV